MLDNVTLKIQGDTINIFTNDQQLLSLAWDAASREILYSLLNATIELGDIDMARAEDWLDKADIEITLRQSKELSQPLKISLGTLVQVRVAENGELSVEGFRQVTLSLLRQWNLSTQQTSRTSNYAGTKA